MPTGAALRSLEILRKPVRFLRGAALGGLGLGLGVGLSGCIPGVEKPELSLEVPASYKAAAKGDADAAVPALAWWRGFRSTELTGLMESAQLYNLDIAVAIAQIVQADAQVGVSGAALLPSISGSANAESQRVAAGSSSSLAAGSTFSQYSLGLSASYIVDFWGKNRATLSASEESATSARYNREVVALTTMATVANTYFQVLAAEDQIKVTRRNLTAAERILALIKSQFAGGTASQLDLSQQEALVATQRAAIPPLEVTVGQNTAALAVLVARAPADFKVRGGSTTQIAVPRVTPGLPSELLYQRPDVRQGRGAARVLQFQRRCGARGVLPADPADRHHRLPERGAGLAVRAGRLVLHAGRRPDPAAVRRLPAGEPAQARQGPATAIPADLSQGRVVGLRRCREGADRVAEVHIAGAPAIRRRRRLAQGIRGRRDAIARRHGQSDHGAAGAADAVHRRKQSGHGQAQQAAGGEQPVPGARRRLDARRHARGGSAMRSVMQRFVTASVMTLIVALGAPAGAVRAQQRPPNSVPLAFGMSADQASQSLGVPLNYVRGTRGNELFVALPNVRGSVLSRRSDGLYLQFGKGRLIAWKGDWGTNPQ
ncbi:hypothetical protein ACVMB0_005070 [Bradyrhizobium sp. USDA 4451]